MIGKWIEITGEIEVLSPLHVGTGEDRPVARGSNDTTRIAAIARDHQGSPYLPGSSLKGVLRRLGGPSDLFGPDRISEATDAKSGAMIFRHAWLLHQPPRTVIIAAADRSPMGPEEANKASFVEAHVAREDASGVAARSLLFHADMVLPGTVFGLRLALQDCREDLLASYLLPILRAFASPDGVAFGRGTRQGQGRLRLREGSVRAGYQPGTETAAIPLAAAPASRPYRVLTLTSDVPFLIHDPMRNPRPPTGGEDQKTNALRPLADFREADAARLTGSTFLGALRGAFEDFEARSRLQTPPSDPKSESDADILFGTPDRRGLLGVSRIKIEKKGETKRAVSVKIDRFSGATIDNALFEVEGNFATKYRVDLTLGSLGAVPSDKASAAAALFEAFLVELQDLVWGGLMLGHAVNRGFGWFKVEVI